MGGHAGDQFGKHGTEFLEVGVEVRMIFHDVGDDGHLRSVVEELGCRVIEAGGVFVALQHGEGAAAKARGVGEISRQPTDEVIGLLSGMLENPSEHGGGGRLPHAACDHGIAGMIQEMLPEKLREGVMRPTAAQHVLQLGIAFGNAFPHHDQLHFSGNIFHGIGGTNGNAAVRQIIHHGSIAFLIGTSNLPPFLRQRGGNAPHRLATNADEVHGGFGGECRERNWS